jgi:DNA-binding NtrC family response regulator
LLGLPIVLPPLRERGSDIILLAKHFSDEFCRENEMKLKNFSAEARQTLLNYPFPGNIRELKAIVELAVVLSTGNTIDVEHLQLNGKEITTDLMAQEKTLQQYSNEIILHFLSKYNQNVKLVANKLDIGKSTIYRLLQARGG